jgi:hypothetical protein
LIPVDLPEAWRFELVDGAGTIVAAGPVNERRDIVPTSRD